MRKYNELMFGYNIRVRNHILPSLVRIVKRIEYIHFGDLELEILQAYIFQASDQIFNGQLVDVHHQDYNAIVVLLVDC